MKLSLSEVIDMLINSMLRFNDDFKITLFQRGILNEVSWIIKAFFSWSDKVIVQLKIYNFTTFTRNSETYINTWSMRTLH